MKYFHCKNCDMKLMPDSTSTARIKRKMKIYFYFILIGKIFLFRMILDKGKNKLIVIKCKSCDRIKRYKINEKEKK